LGIDDSKKIVTGISNGFKNVKKLLTKEQFNKKLYEGIWKRIKLLIFDDC
jgi:hypothetical protein